jgi:sulfur relay (sulfurtransferase) DsrF/TusC family protein
VYKMYDGKTVYHHGASLGQRGMKRKPFYCSTAKPAKRKVKNVAVVPCEFDDLVRLGTHAH